MTSRPLAAPRRPARASLGCLVAFFFVFAVVGASGFWLATAKPLLALAAARSWREASCVVLSSQVAESTSSKGSTYRVEVLYTYSVDGRSYQSKRYGFADGYSSGRQSKTEIVASLPPGTRTPCWVDPADPSRSVLSRAFSPLYLIGLFPLLFFLIGAGGIAWVLRGGRTAGSSAAPLPDPSAVWGVSAPAGDGAAPVELHPTATPLGKLVALAICTLFWDGIVSVIGFQVYQEWKTASQDGCATLVLVPFALIGLLLLFATLRQLLVLFNPRVHLTLNPGTLAVGGIAYLQWSLSGRGGGVRRLRIVLEGREETWRQSGKNHHTERNVFATVVVADTAQPLEIPAGSIRIDVPANTVPSFQAYHNKILWSLKVTCEIAGWPDSEDEYEVLVLPDGLGAVA